MTSPIQLVIPAAGVGSRFRNCGIATPKPLIEIGGFPMILWVISNFKLEADDTVIIVCQRAEMLPDKLKGYLSSFTFKIFFIEIDGLTSGPASTVEMALSKLKKDIPVIVANSDQYISSDLTEFLFAVRQKNFSGTILTMHASGNKWSYIGRDTQGRVNNVVEKRQISTEATVGIYAWANPELLRDALQFLKVTNLLVNNEFYIAPSYNYLISQRLDIGCISVGIHGDTVHGLGTPEDLEEFLRHSHFSDCVKKMTAILVRNQLP
jgi:NDP-sugar pyrophosphorylase family protein